MFNFNNISFHYYMSAANKCEARQVVKHESCFMRRNEAPSATISCVIFLSPKHMLTMFKPLAGKISLAS